MIPFLRDVCQELTRPPPGRFRREQKQQNTLHAAAHGGCLWSLRPRRPLAADRHLGDLDGRAGGRVPELQSLPTISTRCRICPRLPEMVISATGKAISPFSIQSPKAPTRDVAGGRHGPEPDRAGEQEPLVDRLDDLLGGGASRRPVEVGGAARVAGGAQLELAAVVGVQQVALRARPSRPRGLAGRHALGVEGPVPGAAGEQAVVDDRDQLVADLLARACRPGTTACGRRCPRDALGRKPSRLPVIGGSRITGTFCVSTLRAPISRVTRSTAFLAIASGASRSARLVDASYQPSWKRLSPRRPGSRRRRSRMSRR